MVDSKKSKKVAKKVARKVSKKVTKKVTKKPVAKRVTKKVIKKPAAKKVTKKVTKKPAAKKVNKKTNKKTASKKSDNRFEQLQDLLQENLSSINTEKAEVLAKDIWLAGLGAYSKTFEELSEQADNLQGRYAKMNAEGQKIFESLVKRGDSIQADLEKTMKKSRDSLEDRVEDFKKRFGGGLSSFSDIPARLRDAAKKVEELSDKLKKK